MEPVSLDVSLVGKEDTANVSVVKICMGRIVQKNVVRVLTLNNATPLMELVWKDVTGDSRDLVVLKYVQTDRMDTTVTITVVAIARSLEYVTEWEDNAYVKWDGNQIHVTHSVTVISSARIVLICVDIAWGMNSAIMLTAPVYMDVFWDIKEPTVRRNVPGEGTVITVMRRVHTLVSQMSPVIHIQETAFRQRL